MVSRTLGHSSRTCEGLLITLNRMSLPRPTRQDRRQPGTISRLQVRHLDRAPRLHRQSDHHPDEKGHHLNKRRKTHHWAKERGKERASPRQNQRHHLRVYRLRSNTGILCHLSSMPTSQHSGPRWKASWTLKCGQGHTTTLETRSQSRFLTRPCHHSSRSHSTTSRWESEIRKNSRLSTTILRRVDFQHAPCTCSSGAARR